MLPENPNPDDQNIEIPTENEDIEVKIEEDEGQKPEEGSDTQKKDGEVEKKTASEQQAAPKKKKTHRGNNANQQINKLWAELQDKNRENQSLQSKAEAEREARVKMESLTGQSLEESLTSKKKLLTYEYKEADAAGNSDEKARIMSDMSKVDSQLSQIERWKVEKQVTPDQKPKEAPKTQPQQQEEPQALDYDRLYEASPPAGKQWLTANQEWFDANSENFNEEMASDITSMAQKLEAEWRRVGKGHLIGTKAYYREIDDYRKDNWTDESEDSQEDENYTRPRTGFAAPVQQRQAPGQPQQQNRNKNMVTLTKDERDLALSLNRRHANGVEFSDAEKLKEFARNKELVKNIKSNETININTLRRGA